MSSRSIRGGGAESTGNVRYVANYQQFDVVERRVDDEPSDTHSPAVLVNAKRTIRLPSVLLCTEIVWCAFVAWSFGALLLLLFERASPSRWIVLSALLVILLLIVVHLILRARYLLQSRQRIFVGSAAWQTSWMLRPLAIITIVLAVLGAWFYVNNERIVPFDAPPSIALFVLSSLVIVLNLFATARHRQVLKRHIEALERTVSNIELTPSDMRPVQAYLASGTDEQEYEAGSSLRRAGANQIPRSVHNTVSEFSSTIYDTAPMNITQHGTSLVSAQTTVRSGREKVTPLAVPAQSHKNGKSQKSSKSNSKKNKKKGALDSPREDSHGTSLTSVDDGDHSGGMIDEKGPW